MSINESNGCCLSWNCCATDHRDPVHDDDETCCEKWYDKARDINDKYQKFPCIICLFGIACVAIVVPALAGSSKDSGDAPIPQPQPSSTPVPTFNITTLPPDLLEKDLCPSSKDLQRLFSRHTFQFSQIAKPELLTKYAWARFTINEDLVSLDCMKMGQPSCESVVESFRERCESSQRYV